MTQHSLFWRYSFWHFVSVLLCALFILLTVQPHQAYARKYAALVMDADTGEVLHSRQARAARHPASITKVMTLYMLFDAIKAGRFDMETGLKVSRKATQASPSRIGMGRGTRMKVKDAIGTLITKSANDVAVVVAEAIAGSEVKFAQMMTKKARAIGMKNTTFRNASGLHHRKQITTAHDIAILAQRMRKDFPQYYPMFKMRYYKYKRQKYYNHNKLLGKYPGMEGMKTGFINASGFNLVAVASRNNRRVITIVFGGRTGKLRDKQVRKLMDLGFSRLPNLRVVRSPVRQIAQLQQAASKTAKKQTVVQVVLPRKARTKVVAKNNIITNTLKKNNNSANVIELQWKDITDTFVETLPKVNSSEVLGTGAGQELTFTILE